MIYIDELTAEEITILNKMHKNYPRYLSRWRSHAILLSHQRVSVPVICSTYNVCRQTVSTWFSKWEEFGICGLIDLPGRGRPSILTEHQKNNIIKKVKTSPRSLKSVIADLQAELGVTVSIDTIKLICKQAGLVWKRVRKSLRTKRNQKDFDVAQEKKKN